MMLQTHWFQHQQYIRLPPHKINCTSFRHNFTREECRALEPIIYPDKNIAEPKSQKLFEEKYLLSLAYIQPLTSTTPSKLNKDISLTWLRISKIPKPEDTCISLTLPKSVLCSKCYTNASNHVAKFTRSNSSIACEQLWYRTPSTNDKVYSQQYWQCFHILNHYNFEQAI